MMITRGKDNRYTMSQEGEMGRMIVVDSDDFKVALTEMHKGLLLQKAEAYHHQESMSHALDTYDQSQYGEVE